MDYQSTNPVQWFKDGDHPDVFLKEVDGNTKAFIISNDKEVEIFPGDWIIITDNKCYSLKPEVFNRRKIPT